MQTGEAVKYNRTIINTLIQTCNLEMNYPEGMCHDYNVHVNCVYIYNKIWMVYSIY